MFDVVMAIVFAAIAWRTCFALLREREILREFSVSPSLLLIMPLFPIAHLASFGAGLASGSPLFQGAMWALCALPYVAAWYIAGGQVASLQKAGTSRAEAALDAVSSAHGFAMLGLTLVVVRVVLVYAIRSIHI